MVSSMGVPTWVEVRSGCSTTEHRKKYFSRSGATAQRRPSVTRQRFAPLRRCVRNISLGFSISAAPQSKALHLSIQPGPVVIQDLGGPLDVAARSFKRLRDRFAF